MKVVRIFGLAATLVTLAAPVAFAQGGPGQGRGGRMMERLMQGITLSEAQKVKVDSIVQAFVAQMPAMTPGQPMDSTARAKRMEMMQQQNAAVRAVLTPEQQTTFDKNVETMRQNMGNRRRP
ncbi:MAG TPA: hypothetical protein VFZ21_30290 [Gemmatimonadaceae bacterium]|jgi:Spy/CpxP family protein refolding chaperone|nr:hypothetical protein [Gemmatimonadaceae bacterium]